MQNTLKTKSLRPAKPSDTFVKVFESHTFNDSLRPSMHKNKGTSTAHMNDGLGNSKKVYIGKP